MKAIIVTIGDEILIGQIVDTNSAWMAKELTFAGIEVIETRSIADDKEQIVSTIDYAFNNADIVLLTGGIGPTKDDITKKTLTEYFNTELVFSDDVYQNILSLVSTSYGINELTKAQSLVPKSATTIQNSVGTAPITWFDKDEKVLVSMPGVPYEMKYAMENEIIPRLQNRFNKEAYLKKIYLVVGYAESALANFIAAFENSLPEYFGLAYLPSASFVKLRLFVRGNQYQEELNEKASELENLLGDAILYDDDISLEELLGKILKDKKLSVSTAESCTGGNVARLITSIAGSSAYFKGSIVAYANEIKENLLQVSHEAIEEFGAVSEAVVKQMAQGVQESIGTHCSIAISGVAGPESSESKPVGMVWISTRYKDSEDTQLYNFGPYRGANISRASNRALIQMIQMIQAD